MNNNELEKFRSGISHDLLLLANLHDSEMSEKDLLQIKELMGAEKLFNLQLESEISNEADELFSKAIKQISVPITSKTLDHLASDYASIYLNHSIQASPYESVWLDEDSLAMQEPMFQVRDYYKQFELQAPNWRQRADDHLTYELQFVALILAKGSIQHEKALETITDFLDRHLLLWLEDFSRSVTLRCDTPFYGGLAMLTFAYIDELRDILERLLNKPRPTEEEVEKWSLNVEGKEVEVAFMPGQSPSW